MPKVEVSKYFQGNASRNDQSFAVKVEGKLRFLSVICFLNACSESCNENFAYLKNSRYRWKVKILVP